MSELAKLLARAQGIKPGKEYWAELLDFLRYEQIDDAELSAQSRALQEIYAVADNVSVRVQILATLSRLEAPEMQVYVINRALVDEDITHEDTDFVFEKYQGLKDPEKRIVAELKEGLHHELKQHVALKLLNSWGIELSDNKSELLGMLHAAAEFFGRKKSRASKNKKDRMAEIAEQSAIALAKFEFSENIEQDLRKLIEGDNLFIRVYAADLLFRYNPVIAKDALMKTYEHFATRSLAKKFVEKYNQQCCVPVAQDEGLAIAKSALSDELSKTEHFGKAPEEIDLIEEKNVNWSKNEQNVRTFFMAYQYADEKQTFPAAVKVFDAYSEKTEVHIFKTAGIFDFETEEILNCFVGKAYFDKNFAEIIPEDADDAEVAKIEEFFQTHADILDSLYSPENLQLFRELKSGEIYAVVQAYELDAVEKSAFEEQDEDEFNMEVELDEDDAESEESESGDVEQARKTFGELITQARADGESATNEEYFDAKADFEDGEIIEIEVEADETEETTDAESEQDENDDEYEEEEFVAFPAVVLISGGLFKWIDISEYTDITCEHMFYQHLGEKIAEGVKSGTEYNFKLG